MPNMKLYLLSQSENADYDTYDSVVVAAENEEKARLIRPDNAEWDNLESRDDGWATKIENVEVEYLGEAKEGTEEGVIIASFNAG